MKKLSYITLICLATLGACKEDDAFLKETPGDFLTLDNAFLNYAQFKTGLNELYRIVRYNYTNRDNVEDFYHFGIGTDILFRPVNESDPFNDWTYINPTRGIFNDVYTRHYNLIFNANNILAKSENPDVQWTSEAEKLAIQAEARFFRAYAYRYLSFAFGGVPLIDYAITSPNLAYTRNSRAEVYAFCIQDLEFAAANLPVTTSEAGRLVRAAADHYLAEMYIAQGDETNNTSLYTKAAQTAGKVIEGQDGDYKLMTQRFGWRKNEPGKNVFWDLFQMRSATSVSNFNYQTGNKEAIWVIQVDKFLTGGLNSTMPRTNQERAYWPSFWALEKFGYSGPARDWTGRGISMVRPTNFFTYKLWENAGDDMRNSPVNIQRVFYAPNPIIKGKEVAGYDTTYVTNVTLANGTKFQVRLKPGEPIKKEWLTTRQDTMERVFPRVMKMGSDFHYNGDPSNGIAMESYAIRLAETYLLRAEAYLKAGDPVKAAADINAVRGRANAPLATPAQMTIDYILDERARELFGEEMRTLTLTRMGLLSDRTKRFGYSTSQRTVDQKNNLMPIPQPVIDANSQALFPNNTGY